MMKMMENLKKQIWEIPKTKCVFSLVTAGKNKFQSSLLHQHVW